MQKTKLMLLGCLALASLVSGCASTTKPSAPVVVTPQPPQELLTPPQEPVLLKKEELMNGECSTSTKKTLLDGRVVACK